MILARWLKILGVVALATLAGCAAHYAPDSAADPYGLFSGIWHGLICPFSLAVNFVSWLAALVGWSVFDAVQIIGRPNTGLWYYVGFVVGLSFYGGGAA